MLKRIEVRDRVTGEGIPYAVVSVNEKRLATDERGYVTLDIPEAILGTESHISVRSAHYEPLDLAVRFKKERPGVVIRLRPETLGD